MNHSIPLAAELRELHEALGVTDEILQSCALPPCFEPEELVATEPDYYGRAQQLTPAAFEAWTTMKQAAAGDGVTIHLISAYRGYRYQFELIQRKLDSGQKLTDILRVNAAPGYSEHHTGRAVDIGTLNCPALEEEFETTPAFSWLSSQGRSYGFSMTYPRGNAFGIAYEPWHWCFNDK